MSVKCDFSNHCGWLQDIILEKSRSVEGNMATHGNSYTGWHSIRLHAEVILCYLTVEFVIGYIHERIQWNVEGYRGLDLYLTHIWLKCTKSFVIETPF